MTGRKGKFVFWLEKMSGKGGKRKKMKVLLAAVNAKYIHSNPAVYSLKAYAEERIGVSGYGEDEVFIEIAEYTINQRSGEILSDLYARKPDIMAFSCYIWNWRVVRELLGDIWKILPGIPVWLGGPEVSYDAGQVLKEFPVVCGIMTGEGEQTFLELVDYYRKGCGTVIGCGQRDWRQQDGQGGQEALRSRESAHGQRGRTDGLNRIRGIVYRDGEKIVQTEERDLLDMDEIPFFYYAYDGLEAFRNRIIYYESSRGCPFQCSYCLSCVSRGIRLRSIGKVKKELQFFLEHKVPQVKFVDRTFNCSREHTMEIWKYICEHDNGVTNFHFEVEADLLCGEELELLARMRPGLVQLEIGVQSVNPETLREICRYTDLEKLRKATAKLLEKENVHIHLDLIAGLPFEDYNSFGRSFDEVYQMKPHQLQLGFLKTLKGSPMHEKADSYGIKYTSLPPYEVLYSKWISYEEIVRLKKVEEMLELYYNSRQFTHTLSVLEQRFLSPFALYEGLADYYEEQGYFRNSPSRVYRYETLLGFARSRDSGREELYRELLTYDVYLRENMKSRPSFAKEMPDKAWLRRLYQEIEGMPDGFADGMESRIRSSRQRFHIEVFHYPVWQTGGKVNMEKLGKPCVVLFDYGERNPLTKDARTITINSDDKGDGNDKENRSDIKVIG